MRVLYHTTDAAQEILRNGFLDGEGSYGVVGAWLRGVFLSLHPANISDGAKGEEVLEVRLPKNLDLGAYAIGEEGHPQWEWLVPSALLNRLAEVRLLSEEEVDAAAAPLDRPPDLPELP